MQDAKASGWAGETIWEQVNERKRTRLLTRNYVHDLSVSLHVHVRVSSYGGERLTKPLAKTLKRIPLKRAYTFFADASTSRDKGSIVANLLHESIAP